MIDEWVTGESVKASTDQQKFQNLIAKHMKEEAQDLMEDCVGNSEPLSLLCMGGPAHPTLVVLDWSKWHVRPVCQSLN